MHLSQLSNEADTRAKLMGLFFWGGASGTPCLEQTS